MNGNVYGATYGGWQGPAVYGQSGVALPVRPLRPRHDCCPGCMSWSAFGVILSLLASASMALGVADVVLTYQNYIKAQNCGSSSSSSTASICNPNVLVWTWVGVGIWASIPVFIFGFVSVRNASKPQRHSCLEFFAFVCTFLFTPAMCALSAVEVWKGAGVYYWTYSSPLTSDDLVKAAIPLAIAGLGLVELIMCFFALCMTCCGSHYNSGVATYGVGRVELGAPPAPVILRTGTYDRPSYQPPAGPRAQIFPATFNANRGPQLSGASYYSGGGGGFPAPRPTTYNYFSNARPLPAITAGPGGPYGGGQGPYRAVGPNAAYSFYSAR